MTGRRKFIKGAAFAALLAGLSATGPANGGCKTSAFHFAFGRSEDSATTRVDREGICNFLLKAPYTGQARPMWQIDSLVVSRAPSHGTVAILSNYRFTYEPNRNYVGHDEYSVVMNFDRAGDVGATRVNFDVDVVDRGNESFLEKAAALSNEGREVEALAMVDRGLSLSPYDPHSLRFRIAVLAVLGRYAEAREAYKRYNALPGVQLRTIADVRAAVAHDPPHDPIVAAGIERRIEGLRKAGMPEQ